MVGSWFAAVRALEWSQIALVGHVFARFMWRILEDAHSSTSSGQRYKFEFKSRHQSRQNCSIAPKCDLTCKCKLIFLKNKGIKRKTWILSKSNKLKRTYQWVQKKIKHCLQVSTQEIGVCTMLPTRVAPIPFLKNPFSQKSFFSKIRGKFRIFFWENGFLSKGIGAY